jgi:hypothetical protein
MSKLIFGIAPTSVKLRVKLMDSSKTDGSGLTGLTSASSGLIISTIQNVRGGNGEASATVYTFAGSTIETISTIGTYVAPTATKCRFKEVDATNHPGVYEIQIADARFANSTNPMTLLVSILGVTNLAQCDVEIECQNVSANVIQLAGQAVTASAGVTFPASVASPTNITAGIITTAISVTNDVGITQVGADKVWSSAARTLTAFGFTVASNITQILGTALTETAGYLAAGFKKFFNIASPVATVASVDQTGDSYSIVDNGTYGNSALNTTIGTRLATSGYTAPDNTNIANIHDIVKSGGTGDNVAIKTQTDKMQFDGSNNIKSVKNATTAGTADFNATEKLSITTAASASTPDVTLAASQPNYAPAKAGDAMKIYGTKQTLDALNDVSAATVNSEVDTALSDIKLDHLVAVAESGDVVNSSIIAKLASKSATPNFSSFNNTTDSLEAIADAEASGTFNANVISIDGQATNGNNATLKLKKLDIKNLEGLAINIAGSGDNTTGVVISGGMEIYNAFGDALRLKSTGDGGEEGQLGYGLSVEGNIDGVHVQAQGIGVGVKVYGGNTGAGVELHGGFTSGDGIDISATDGHGIRIVAGGTNKSGLSLVKSAGTGHDLNFETPDCTIPTVTNLTNNVNANMVSIVGEVNAAQLLAVSAKTMANAIVDNSNFLPTTTEFEAATITESDLSHYRDRWVIFTNGPLFRQARLIKNYSLESGKGHFVCDAFTQVPAAGDGFIIV